MTFQAMKMFSTDLCSLVDMCPYSWYAWGVRQVTILHCVLLSVVLQVIPNTESICVCIGTFDSYSLPGQGGFQDRSACCLRHGSSYCSLSVFFWKRMFLNWPGFLMHASNFNWKRIKLITTKLSFFVDKSQVGRCHIYIQKY